MDKVRIAAAAVGAGILMFALAKIVAAKPPPEGIEVIGIGVRE